jgi:hypothetical protein
LIPDVARLVDDAHREYVAWEPGEEAEYLYDDGEEALRTEPQPWI